MNYKKKSIEELDRISTEKYRKIVKRKIIVILDNVRSAHNVGAIFRTSDAFLIEKIYLCGITPFPPNNDIHKTALGATESVEWEYSENAIALIDRLKRNKFNILAIEQTHGSKELDEINVCKNEKYALIFGHEVYGVDDNIVKTCDQCIEIKQEGTKHSLNVSVSAGIVLHYFSKKISL